MLLLAATAACSDALPQRVVDTCHGLLAAAHTEADSVRAMREYANDACARVVGADLRRQIDSMKLVFRARTGVLLP